MAGNKQRWRWRWSRLGCGVAIVLLPVPGLSYLLYCNQPLPRESEPRTPPNPNGFVAAFDAVRRLTPAPEGSPLVRRDFTNPRVLREKLAPEQAGLDALRKSLPLEWGAPHVQDLSQEFPYLPQFRDGARKFAAESRLALAEGRSGEAMERALDAIELGSRVGQGGPLVHGLVAMACAAIGVDQAERVVPALSAEEARWAGARLERLLARYPTLAGALEEERRVALATLRRVFRNELDTHLLAGGAPRDPARRPPPWYLYPKPWAYREMDRGFRAYIAEAEKPVVRRRPVELPREIMSRMLLRPIGDIAGSFDKNHVGLRMLRLELALQEHRRRRGGYPESAARLEPPVRTELWADPYSGTPYMYGRRGESYLLYSVGPDGKDDQGMPVKRGGGASGDLVAGKLGAPQQDAARP